MGSLRERSGRLAIAASRTRPDDLGALLAAMPFSSDRAALAATSRLSCDPVRQIAEDHTIGNVVAGVSLPC